MNRTFDISKGNKILRENNLDLILVDSNYAFHINEKKINKGIMDYSIYLSILKLVFHEVVAIGDSETDIPMFKLCKNSLHLKVLRE